MTMVPSPSDPVSFTFPETAQEVRSVTIDGDLWWVGRDVCAALEISKPENSLALLDEDEKATHSVGTLGGDQSVTIINEPGLYSLILRSRKPQAKAFKRWITHDVIPSIRKQGRYEVSPLKEITADVGVRPLREQAEILVILKPVLPESYVAATGKVIMARAMGDRPELLPAETPLYAATFLAERGHKAKTVTKFQSGFGARVSNLYFKVHGRRPEKIPGPAGSRIDKVAVYTDEDRPLLEQVYAVMLDAIRAFETGGQVALGEGEAA